MSTFVKPDAVKKSLVLSKISINGKIFPCLLLARGTLIS